MLRAELLLAAQKRAAAERLSHGQLAVLLKQQRQVAHGVERIRVVGAELLLTPLERAPIERLGLSQLALLIEQLRQLVHCVERVRVVGAELPLAPLERAPELVDGARHQLPKSRT